MKFSTLCLFGILASARLLAQTADNTAIVKALQKHWQSSKELTLAVANAMPEDGYSFKATDAEMSFGAQMNHIAQADNNYCSLAIGEKAPTNKQTDTSKAAAIQNLNAAFDYCLAGIAKMTDAELEQKVTARGSEISRFELFWGGFTHTAHHRGQAEVYLRLKGITPPTYKF